MRGRRCFKLDTRLVGAYIASMTIDLDRNAGGLEFIELNSLKGQFLAASPAMNDVRFAGAVVLMVRHDDGGALGFIINRPVENLSFYDLLEQLNLKNPHGVTDHLVFHGGPVRASNGFVIYAGAQGLRDETRVIDGVYYSRSLESLRMISEGRGPEEYLVCLGTAEWSAGQLEDELTGNYWLPCAPRAEQIFREDIGALWTDVLAEQGIAPATFTNVAGHA